MTKSLLWSALFRSVVSECGSSHTDSNTGFATSTQAPVTEKSQRNCSAGDKSPDQWQPRQLETQTLLSVTTEAKHHPLSMTLMNNTGRKEAQEQEG